MTGGGGMLQRVQFLFLQKSYNTGTKLCRGNISNEILLVWTRASWSRDKASFQWRIMCTALENCSPSNMEINQISASYMHAPDCVLSLQRLMSTYEGAFALFAFPRHVPWCMWTFTSLFPRRIQPWRARDWTGGAKARYSSRKKWMKMTGSETRNTIGLEKYNCYCLSSLIDC